MAVKLHCPSRQNRNPIKFTAYPSFIGDTDHFILDAFFASSISFFISISILKSINIKRSYYHVIVQNSTKLTDYNVGDYIKLTVKPVLKPMCESMIDLHIAGLNVNYEGITSIYCCQMMCLLIDPHTIRMNLVATVVPYIIKYGLFSFACYELLNSLPNLPNFESLKTQRHPVQVSFLKFSKAPNNLSLERNKNCPLHSLEASSIVVFKFSHNELRAFWKKILNPSNFRS